MNDQNGFELMDIAKRSLLTGKKNSMQFKARPEDFGSWTNGTLIQDAMPYLDTEVREFLISGMSIEEQQSFFDQGLGDE